MKIKFKVYWYLALVYSGMPSKVRADSNFMIHQFRAPYSLNEALQDGLVYIQDLLDQAASLCAQGTSQVVQAITNKLEELESLYNRMHAKSFFNEIRRDQRDFLQNLIDRIDQMIYQLENDESVSSQDQEALKRNLAILHNLKEQLSS